MKFSWKLERYHFLVLKSEPGVCHFSHPCSKLNRDDNWVKTCFRCAVWVFCSVMCQITKAHSQSCNLAFRMQLTKLHKADLASFADGLWVSCGIILNYIGSQPLVLKWCSELRVAMCLDHSVRKQVWQYSSSKGACRARGFQHLWDCSSPLDALWGWPGKPTMGCGAFCPKGRRLDLAHSIISCLCLCCSLGILLSDLVFLSMVVIFVW